MSIREYINKNIFKLHWNVRKTLIQAERQDLWITIRTIVKERAVVRGTEQVIIRPNGTMQDTSGWLVDIRNISLNPLFLKLYADIFWQLFEKEYPFQVGGQEIAAIPLISAIVHKSHALGKPVSGFMIRKERKRIGLQKRIEGRLGQEKILLVDDVMNSGTAIAQQLAVLTEEKRLVHTVFVLCAYKNIEEYKFLWKNNIRLVSLFTLAELDLKIDKNYSFPKEIFATQWEFSDNHPDLFHIVQKSTPCIDATQLYVGMDNGIFVALNQENGSVVWKYTIPSYLVKKPCFSSPSMSEQYVYVASKNSVCSALDKITGVPTWSTKISGTILASPLFILSQSTLFISIIHDHLQQKGETVCIDASTGKIIWQSAHPNPFVATAIYVEKHNIIVFGDTDGCIYALNASTGTCMWISNTYEKIDQKGAYDSVHEQVLIGTTSGKLFVIDAYTGKIQTTYSTYAAIGAEPVIDQHRAYIVSHDEYTYCIDLQKRSLVWKKRLQGSIGAAPLLANSKLYVGTYEGIIYKMCAVTGNIEGTFCIAERITNPIVYNKQTGYFFVTTHANKILCLREKNCP